MREDKSHSTKLTMSDPKIMVRVLGPVLRQVLVEDPRSKTGITTTRPTSPSQHLKGKVQCSAEGTSYLPASQEGGGGREVGGVPSVLQNASRSLTAMDVLEPFENILPRFSSTLAPAAGSPAPYLHALPAGA